MITLRMSTFLLKNTTASFVRVGEFLQAAGSSQQQPAEQPPAAHWLHRTALSLSQLGVQTDLETLI